jgi:hypothetical protein
VLFACLAFAGCAGQRVRAGAAEPEADVPSRPAEADPDASYYQERAAALATGARAEIAQTDFARFRRGHLYTASGAGAGDGEPLDERLIQAVSARDHSATLELTAKILADDATDIQAHLARSVALRKLGRSAESDFHRELAASLVKSIMASGDGHSVSSAWTVFDVKEEYAVLKVLGAVPASSSTVEDGSRHYDVVKAKKASGGDEMELHFDVSELFAERQRKLRAR